MGLPFFVVHGALVWKALIVVGILVSIALVRGFQNLVARRDARIATRGLDRKTDEGVVRGKLGGGMAATLVAGRESGLTDSVDHRAEAIWIETADGKVELDGAIRVVAGSHVHAARNRVPNGTPDGLSDTKVVTATLRSVSPGDEVIAFGRLERTPGAQATDYRADAGALVLRAPEDGPITLAARSPRVAIPRLAIITIILLATASGFITWGLEKAFGEAERKACWDPSDHADNGPLEITNTHACALAAAMPGSRDNALDRLVDVLERDPYRDRESLERLAALTEIARGCDGELAQLDHAERYEELLTVAARCGNRRYQHIALVELGRFEDAVAMAVPEETLSADSYPQTLAALPTGATLVLAGRWNDAAAAALRDADDIRQHDTDNGSGVRQLSFQCLAELLHVYAGDTGAVARLRALAAKPDGTVCTPELLEVVPEAERAALFAVTQTNSLYVDILLDDERWLAGDGHPFESDGPEAVLGHPDDMDAASHGALLWLAKTTAALPPKATATQQAKLDEWQAVSAVIDGDLAKAHEHAAKAVIGAATDPNANYVFRDVATLQAAIDLYRADATPAYTVPAEGSIERAIWLHSFGGLLLRRGDPLLEGTYFGPRDEYKGALETAEHGDGVPLAKEIASQDLAWWQDVDVMSVLPRIKTGRDAVVRQLVWAGPQDHARLQYWFPFSVALHAAGRRSALQVAGESAEAARWSEIYKRYDQALRDRRKLIPLAIWAH